MTLLVLPMAACSALVDGAFPAEAPPMDSCAGLLDGTACSREGITAPLVCLEERCTNSRCGDGVLDPRPKLDGSVEACDDGNSVGADGCEPDCTESSGCTGDGDCPASEIPCTVGVCDATSGACSFEEAADGAACDDGEGNAGVCAGGVCAAASCGNDVIDAGEQCDDGNTDPDDGCSPFCKPECLDNNACPQDPCAGYFRCVVEVDPVIGQIGTCEPDTGRPVLVCDAPCERCDSLAGSCVPSVEADADFDGEPSPACGGDDCNDSDPLVYPGLEETCGDGIDSNCNGDADEGALSAWFADCDGDRFATTSAERASSCGPPMMSPTSCFGSWTTRAPTATVNDCADGDPAVFPGQREFFASPYYAGRDPSYDYDCSGRIEYEFDRVLTPNLALCGRDCDAPPVVGLTSECGALTTLYECVAEAGRCSRASTARGYLGCH